ncbi:MAG: glycoside hydrolase family 99-like domain-containing protein [bacterium]|nr:glycoside hydrolase family 99-like domain-containing protein [bacterium]
MLGAYYYAWYGRPTLSIIGGGVWRWGYANQPVLGEYDSRDEKVISRHIDWAKSAGIDFFAVCWADINSWDDITLRDYFLKNPKSSEMKFCLHYDGIQALNRYRFHTYPSYDFNDLYTPTKTKGEKFLEDFEYFADTYFNLPQYLRIDGKPVVMIYNASAYRNIPNYFEKLEASMAKRGISLFLVADAVYWSGVRMSLSNFKFLWENPPKEALKTIWRALRRKAIKNYESDFKLSRYFKAITGYNMYSLNRTENFLENVEEVYKKFWEYAKSQNLYFIPNVMPGYDDRNQNGLQRSVLERKGGEFYKKFWEIARKYLDPKLPLAMITTFNEWHEGTEIEPSKEHNDQYLELTKALKKTENLS